MWVCAWVWMWVCVAQYRWWLFISPLLWEWGQRCLHHSSGGGLYLTCARMAGGWLLLLLLLLRSAQLQSQSQSQRRHSVAWLWCA